MPYSPASPCLILTVNVGSSSLKIALYESGNAPVGLVTCAAERIGSDRSHLVITDSFGTVLQASNTPFPDHSAAFDQIADVMQESGKTSGIAAIAHRFVHGGTRFSAPTLLTDDAISELDSLVALDPDHLPQALATLSAARTRFPDVPQIACFDTAFHQTMPPVARTLPIPNRFAADGFVRYGFHGLSYEFIVGELRRINALSKRVVVAHLGSGSSLCAIRNGESIDTTMGFTPTGGVIMGTRSGDLDPGVIFALHRQHGLTLSEIEAMLNKKSGLLGISGVSADTRDLLEAEATDPRAALALDCYCTAIAKSIGAYAAVLSGLDTLIFTGGVGEHSAPIRERICANLEFLGISLDPEQNKRNGHVISRNNGPVTVRVLATDENQVLARSALPFISQDR